MELPAGTDTNVSSSTLSNRQQFLGKHSGHSSGDNSASVASKKSGGFFGSKARRLKLHSNKVWQEKTRLMLQR